MLLEWWTCLELHIEQEMCADKHRSCFIILSTAIAGDLGLLQCEATLYSNNNRLMMKARWRPIEWRPVCVCGVLWLPWKPLRLLLPAKGPYNWVLLSYYSLWFLLTMTSQSSPHLTMQVSAYLMSSKPFKYSARQVWVNGAAMEDKESVILQFGMLTSKKTMIVVLPHHRAYVLQLR